MGTNDKTSLIIPWDANSCTVRLLRCERCFSSQTGKRTVSEARVEAVIMHKLLCNWSYFFRVLSVSKCWNYAETKYVVKLKKTLAIKLKHYPYKLALIIRKKKNIIEYSQKKCLSRRTHSITLSPILVKEMCVLLDLLWTTVRTYVSYVVYPR
jgi:hypothetical protein